VLDFEARQCMIQLLPHLSATVNFALVARYCRLWSRYVRAERSETPDFNLADRLLRLEQSLGMTPRSRQNLENQ
jgi:phage terminase small subunit